MKNYSIKNIRRKIFYVAALVMIPVLLISGVFGTFTVKAANYDAEYRINRTLKVSGGGTYNIRTIHQYYDDNEYVSLRDMAAALSGTEAQFSLKVESDSVALTTGAVYSATGCENEYFEGNTRSQSEKEYTRSRNSFSVNGVSNYYYTFIYEIEPGIYDCYMYLTDLVLILEKKVWTEGSVLCIDPDEELILNMEELEAQDFFSGTNSVLIGDATTGEIYYSYNGSEASSMASTTKLMTYLLVMDAVTSEKISLDDIVTMSANVNKLSYSCDGVIRIQTGATATVSDLIGGMLLPSSNECALALAEYVSGSEEAFVVQMNNKAAELGLSDATEFYNCNGLPTFTDTAFESKIQNHISAVDMFKLASHILAVYPQITEITSQTGLYLASFGKTVYNTNPMLRNMTGAVGLKTGTTNRAGCCLVSAVQVKKNDGTHTLIAVEFGAEDVVLRNVISKTLLMYGEQVLDAGGISSIEDYDAEKYASDGMENVGAMTGEIPTDPDKLAQLIVWTARNYMEIPTPGDEAESEDGVVTDD